MMFRFIFLLSLFFIGISYAHDDLKIKQYGSLRESHTKKLWKTAISYGHNSHLNFKNYPESYGDNIYAINNNNVLAINNLGDIIWKFESNNKISSCLAVNDEYLVCGNVEGLFFVLDRLTGKTKFSIDLKSSVFSKPLLLENYLYLKTRDNTIHAYDLSNGLKIWLNIDFSENYESVNRSTCDGLFFYKDKILTISSLGKVGMIDKMTGDTLWERRIFTKDELLENAKILSLFVLDNNIYIVLENKKFLVYSIPFKRVVSKEELDKGFNFEVIKNTIHVEGVKGLISFSELVDYFNTVIPSYKYIVTSNKGYIYFINKLKFSYKKVYFGGGKFKIIVDSQDNVFLQIDSGYIMKLTTLESLFDF